MVFGVILLQRLHVAVDVQKPAVYMFEEINRDVEYLSGRLSEKELKDKTTQVLWEAMSGITDKDGQVITMKTALFRA